MKQTEVAFKQNSKRNSKSYNDINRTMEGRFARKANKAFKHRKQSLFNDFALAY